MNSLKERLVKKFLREKIIELANKDQHLRRKLFNRGYASTDKDWDDLKKNDIESTEYIKKIIKEYGLPTISMVGKSAENFAWMLVQHSPDINFQKEYLNLLKQAKHKDIQLEHIAYLEDKINIRENKPQKYGTQVIFDKVTNKPIPKSLDNPDDVDKLRKSMGMEDLETYLRSFF